MRISIIGLLIILGMVAGAFAQAPDTMWTRAYNDTSLQTGSDVCQFKDGFIIVGARMMPVQNNYDVYIMKISAWGALQWTRTYGGSGYDVAYSVCPTLDGNLMVAGTSNYRTYLLKINQFGDTLWTGKYNVGDGDWCYAVRQAPDSGFIVAVVASIPVEYENMGILKVDARGRQEWIRNFGGTGQDKAFDVYPTSDGNFALVGFREIQPGGHLPAWLIMVGPNGDSLWSRYYERGACDFTGVEQLPDGGFILAGRSTISMQNWWDVYLVRTNAIGDTLWTRTFGGHEWDGANSVERTDDGNFFIGAYTFSFGGDVDFYFLKVDSLGNLLWQTAVGSEQYDWGIGAAQCSEGGYIMVGAQWLSDTYSMDVYAVRLLSDEDLNLIDREDSIIPQGPTISPAYPNPFNAHTTICYTLPRESDVSFEIIDITGRRVNEFALGIRPAGTHSFIWNAEGLSSGIYFLKMSAGLSYRTGKCILLR